MKLTMVLLRKTTTPAGMVISHSCSIPAFKDGLENRAKAEQRQVNYCEQAAKKSVQYKIKEAVYENN